MEIRPQMEMGEMGHLLHSLAVLRAHVLAVVAQHLPRAQAHAQLLLLRRVGAERRRLFLLPGRKKIGANVMIE
jgi:hypothetical protein